MSNDNSAALHEFLFDLNRIIANTKGLMLRNDIPDREALEIGWADLMSARDMFILALTPVDVSH